jgi:hypothetical protein
MDNRMSKSIPWVAIVLMLAFAGHYYFSEVTEVSFSNTMKLEDRSCGEMGCTISFMGAFDDRTKILFIDEDSLFENQVSYTKDQVMTVEGKIRYRKLRSHFWVKENAVFSKIDGKDVSVEEESSFLFKIFKKIMGSY